MRNEKALDVFMSKIADAQQRLAELTVFVDEHMHKNPEEISWGCAGDAGYMVEKLTELTDWAFKRGEYAE